MSELEYARHLRTETRREPIVIGGSGSIKAQPSAYDIPRYSRLKYVISSTVHNETSEDASLYS